MIDMRHNGRNFYCPGLALIIASFMLLACGSGGGGATASSGGTGGTGISAGTVSAIGSITVNGRRFDTGNAEIFMEGQSVGFGDQTVFVNLAIGMVVRVEGDIENAQSGRAHCVYFNDDIRGPVESMRQIDSTTTELRVLGKTIVVRESTQTTGLDLNSLSPGDWVQVSGFQGPDGRFFATFFTGSIPNAKANLKGTVSQLDEFNWEFEVDGISIDFRNADLSGIGQLSTGLNVEVTGDLDFAHRLIAEKIEMIDLLGTDDADSVELEGIISTTLSDTRFILNGVTVILSAETDYDKGDASEVQSGARMEVEGRLVGGEMYAGKVVFLDDAKVESNVGSNDIGQSELHLTGLTDVIIRYNEITKVTGAVNATGDITDQHHVKIIGIKTHLNEVSAIHIIVLSNLSGMVKLQGQMENDPGPIISILGQSIDLTSIPDENFEAPEGNSVGYLEFLDLASAGDMVAAKGAMNGDEVEWQSIILEH